MLLPAKPPTTGLYPSRRSVRSTRDCLLICNLARACSIIAMTCPLGASQLNCASTYSSPSIWRFVIRRGREQGSGSIMAGEHGRGHSSAWVG